MTDTISEIELIQNLDFEPACNGTKVVGRPVTCDLPATWKSTTRCCGYVNLFCDAHHEYFAGEWVRKGLGKPLFCCGCSTHTIVSHEFLDWQRL